MVILVKHKINEVVGVRRLNSGIDVIVRNLSGTNRKYIEAELELVRSYRPIEGGEPATQKRSEKIKLDGNYLQLYGELYVRIAPPWVFHARVHHNISGGVVILEYDIPPSYQITRELTVNRLLGYARHKTRRYI